MPKLKFIKNNKKYHEFIRNLRNDKRVKAGFIEQGHITRKQQEKYMKTHNDHYFIGLCDGKPAGYVGVIDNDIRVAVSPDFQKRGIGLFLIQNIKKKYPHLEAKIKIDNKASLKLFKKSGFKLKYYIYG